MFSALVLTLTTFLIVYVAKFSEDFKKEDLEKVAPFLVLIVLFALLTLILSSVGGN